eukprot:g2615.t1
MMIVITGITDLISDYLCESINGVTENINVDFLGTILLPIAGNACEHLGAVRFAMDDKPGLAVGIAIGSSTQVALFVVPFAVIVGWMWDVPMTLDFGPVNTAVIFFSVLLATVLMSDGRSHWLKGHPCTSRPVAFRVSPTSRPAGRGSVLFLVRSKTLM